MLIPKIVQSCYVVIQKDIRLFVTYVDRETINSYASLDYYLLNFILPIKEEKKKKINK